MTSTEIIDAINICVAGNYCDGCAFAGIPQKRNRTCCEQLMAAAKKLIEQQAVEIYLLRDAGNAADNCAGCKWEGGARPQKCACCRRNRSMKDNYKEGK